MLGSTTAAETPAAQGEAAPYKADNPHHPRKALKNGRHCAVIGEDGWMPAGNRSGYGLYSDDSRFLSCLSAQLDHTDLVLLSSDISDGFGAEFVYSNNAFGDVPEQSLLLQRKLVLADGLHEQWTITNYSLNPVKATLRVGFAADFVDMFEVRGSVRPQRGQTATPSVFADRSRVRLSYRGLDNVSMNTDVCFGNGSVHPDRLSGDAAEFDLVLDRHAVVTIEMAVTTAHRKPGQRHAFRRPRAFALQASRARADYEGWRNRGASITTGNDVFNQLVERSYRDLFILRQPVPGGNMLAAGIPWFVCGFGRDQAVTGLQTNWLLPELGTDITKALSEYLGEIDEDFTAQKPGKVMHELRLGEMARLREIAFCPYFGTVDATPLWLMLVREVFGWTGNLDYVRALWPKIQRTLAYLDREVADGNGYLRYGGEAGAALSNQGWKDSGDSVSNSAGDLAKAPIALCEPQGYLYSAWRGIAEVADLLGHAAQAQALREKAADLAVRFQRDFWMTGKQFIALALDADSNQCDVISSNPGHILASGILTDEQAQLVASRLMQPDMFCGWGIRTLASSESRYNPLSYHNGSVWPHDNSMTARQMGLLGHKDSVLAVFEALFDVAVTQPDLRLPELFAGTERSSKVPVRYLVSCIPQAWAAGSMFQILQASLGLTPDAVNNTLRVVRPVVPASLGTVTVSGLRVGESTVDLQFTNVGGKTTCVVASLQGDLKVECVD